MGFLCVVIALTIYGGVIFITTVVSEQPLNGINTTKRTIEYSDNVLEEITIETPRGPYLLSKICIDGAAYYLTTDKLGDKLFGITPALDNRGKEQLCNGNKTTKR
jgi:hypothetical protein